jgi:methionyl-tRNA synthetase
VLRTALNLIRIFAIAASPLIPFTTSKVFDALHLPTEEQCIPFNNACDLEYIKENHPFVVPELLFKRIEEDDIAQLTEKYGGNK